MAHDLNNTPNTELPFKVLTSYNPDIFASNGNLHGGGDAGFGSLLQRDVATEMVMYKPYRNALDTLIQVTGGFEVATNSVHEWIENDELLPDEATIVAGDDTSFLDDTGYTASATGKLKVDTDQGDIYRGGDVVRYEGSGGYTYALVTDVTGDVLSIEAFTGDEANDSDFDSGTGGVDNLLAPATGTIVQRLHSLRGSDLNYDVEPRGTIPKMHYTYLQKIVHDMRLGKRAQNEEHYLNLIDDTEQKLFREMRRSREIQALYGYKGKITLGNGDTVYSSPGLYDQIAAFNKQSSDMTDTGFDAVKFKNAIYSFIEHNFGAESGGPETRTMFISGKFASYLSQAFEDSKRFYEVEYVAGVRVMRWEHNLGNIDFVYLPILDYKHPIPGGSLKESAPKAVGMLCPIQECVTRLVMQGEGPSSELFKERGGDEEENMRTKTTEGLKFKLKQYCGVLEEI